MRKCLTPVKLVVRKQLVKKTTPKPVRQPAVVKTLMNIFSDPDSPVVQALVGALEKSITQTIQKELSDQSAKIDQLLSKIEKLEKENHEKNVKIESLKSDIEELQQYGRRNAIVISGLPENQNENTDELILNLAKDKLNVSLEQY